MLGRAGLPSMLDLHVGWIWLVHDVLPLLVEHLRLVVLRVHHGHFARVADLWRVALLRPYGIRAIGSRRVVLLVLRRSLALHRLVVHGHAHVSLVL